ncbi:MAG: drug resistance transporter, EmrB/QacA subfamily, partial [Solirubrobacterales bacterium]|nr:drug resistance transporter, EmrB/QacA subfamily [Solirubrobacterales bacterium]
LDMTIVNVALPSIQHDLHFSQANLTWVVNAYLITYGGFLLLAGRLGDLVGRKRMFLFGLVVFTLASGLCAVASSQAMLIVARFIQGVGGALTASVVLAILSTEFPAPRERAKAMSIYTFVAVSGGSIGLLAGGGLTQAIDWHWIFVINIPIGVATLLLGRALIREHEGTGLGGGIDVGGSVLVTAALMLGVYAIVKSADFGWGSPQTLGMGGGAVALLAAFFALEGRLRNPIFPLSILRVPGLGISSLLRGLMVVGMFSAFFLGTLYLEHVLGYSPWRTGLAFLPMTLTVATLSLGITARIMQRFGPKRPLIAGLLLAMSSLLLLASAGAHQSYFPTVFGAFLLLGAGAGMSFMPLLTMAMANVPARDAGLASGIVNVSMQVAGAVGLAVLGTIATDHSRAVAASGHSTAVALTDGYHLAFVIGAVTVATGAIIALLALKGPDRTAREAEPVELPAREELEAQAA